MTTRRHATCARASMSLVAAALLVVGGCGAATSSASKVHVTAGSVPSESILPHAALAEISTNPTADAERPQIALGADAIAILGAGREQTAILPTRAPVGAAVAELFVAKDSEFISTWQLSYTWPWMATADGFPYDRAPQRDWSLIIDGYDPPRAVSDEGHWHELWHAGDYTVLAATLQPCGDADRSDAFLILDGDDAVAGIGSLPGGGCTPQVGIAAADLVDFVAGLAPCRIGGDVAVTCGHPLTPSAAKRAEAITFLDNAG